ncbi:hypothetical protein AAF134_11665 [Synechococcus lacustris Tous-12m]
MGLEALLKGWIETFAPLRELDLLPLLRRENGSPGQHHPWGQLHRADWEARGLVIWPRGANHQIATLPALPWGLARRKAKG